MDRARLGTPIVAAILGLVSGLAIDRASPAPEADVRRGSEDAFASGLHRRELRPGHEPLRWTSERAVFRFQDLPKVPAVVEVEVQGHRGPVTVVADGVILGVLGPGVSRAALPLPAARTHTIELRPQTFEAGDGRRLGTQLVRLAVRPDAPSTPTARLLLVFALPAAALAFAAGRARVPPPAALLIALGGMLVQAALLWSSGLVRSPYATVLAGALAAGAILALAFAALCARLRPGAAAWAFLAFLAAYVVQGLIATAPLVVASDVVFHANKLAAVAGGDLFPTSVTQHARPFRFPYGVSFYALLTPLFRLGIDGVLLVRVGAAVAGVLASCALFGFLARRDPFAAAVAVTILQLLPATFDVAYSYGNYSNAFGQSLTVMFFAWWVTGRRWPVGAFLLALGALAHFSSLIVLLALCVALVVMDRHTLSGERGRLLALATGLGAVALYYAQFAGMVAEQLPRLLEGGGQGRAGAMGASGAAWRQVMGVWAGWGIAAVALACWGLPRGAGRAEQDLRAFWTAGLALAIPAVLSPLEVRYGYALTAPLAVAAGAGFVRLFGRGGRGRLLALILLLAQVVIGARALAEAVLHRYRP